MLDRIWKENKIPIMIALLQWFFTTVLQVDRFFFIYESETVVFVLTKILYFFALATIWVFIFNVVQKIKNGDKEYKRGFEVFSIYFSILMMFLCILWPGTWSWDDALSLLTERWYNWTDWQHIFTGIFQMVLLQIMPFPGGIIFLQNLIIALIVAFAVVKLEISFNIPRLKKHYLDIIVKLLPFLTPPVLMYQFSGYRMGVYIYVEFSMLIIWLCSIKDKKKWGWGYAFLFSALCAITATWRTESLFYIPLVNLGILFIKKEILSNKKKWSCIFLMICIYSGINYAQNQILGNNSYKLISIIRPCTELVRAADRDKDAELLEDLSRAFYLDVIYNNPEENGEVLYWNYGAVNSEHTDEDYKACLKAFVRLCLKYPRVVIHERCNLFINSTGIRGRTVSNVNQAYNFFDVDNGNNAAEEVKNAEWIANKPVFPILRKAMIYFLDMRIDNHGYALKRVVWNIIPPLIILIYFWCKTIQKKRWREVLLMTAVLVKIPIIILTQPSEWFMYFLSFYFLGYVVFVYSSLIFIANIKKRKDT